MVPSGSARSDPACQPWTNAWPVVGGEMYVVLIDDGSDQGERARGGVAAEAGDSRRVNTCEAPSLGLSTLLWLRRTTAAAAATVDLGDDD